MNNDTFDSWWEANYGAGRNNHHSPYRIANRSWQAALSSQPVAATGEELARMVDDLVAAHKDFINASRFTALKDEADAAARDRNAIIQKLADYRAAQRTAHADGGMDAN